MDEYYYWIAFYQVEKEETDEEIEKAKRG